MKRYRLCGKRDVSFLPTSFKSPHSLRPMTERDTAYFESYTTDVFPVFRSFLLKGASKEKIVWHLSMLLLIFVLNIFVLQFIFLKFFRQNFFPKLKKKKFSQHFF